MKIEDARRWAGVFQTACELALVEWERSPFTRLPPNLGEALDLALVLHGEAKPRPDVTCHLMAGIFRVVTSGLGGAKA